MIYFLDNSLQLQKIVTSKNVISAIHEHELNGLIRADVELDLSYANKFLVLGIDHVGYYYKDEFYLHKIQRVEYDHVNDSVKVVLRHIFFEDMIFGKLIQDVRPQNQDALSVSRQTIDANTRWQTIMTDVTGRLSTNFYWQVPYEVVEFMVENYRIEYLPKILFDGQKINGFQLHLANKIGEDKNIRIPYGSRVLDLKYEEDYSEIITKLVVHGKGEEVGDGYGRRINISDVNFSRNGVESPVGSLYLEDESITNTYGNDGQTPREGREVFEDIEDANELAEAGYQHYLQVSRPQMLFTADVADIGDVGIGDSVMIIRREYDVYFNARIHKLSVDLLYPEDAQVELGDYKHFKESKIARKTREKNNRVQGQLSDRITRLKKEANDFINGEFSQALSEFEQNLIDQKALIEADRENMTNLIEGTRTEFTDNLNAEITQTKEYAEQQAQEKAETVRTDLETVTSGHQALIDGLEDNVMNIDTFIGDKSQTLAQQFADVESDFNGLQSDLLERINNIDTQSFNLIRGSRFDEVDRYATSGGTVHDDEDMPYFRYGISSENIQYISTVDDIQFEAGKTYTLSLDYRTSSDVSIDYLWIIPTDDSADINIRNNITESDMAGIIPDDLWHRTFLTFTVPRNLTGTLRLGSDFSTSAKGQTDIRLPYLTTSGNTQWVFHPSDSYESIISVMSRIDDFEQSIWAELEGVYGNLSSTRTELQEQLDAARAELEGIEVGGRNLVLNTGGKLYRTFGSSATLSEVVGATRLDWTSNYQTAMGEKLSVPLITGETYTLTFEARGTLDSPYLEVYILASSGANLEFSSALSDRVVTEEFKKYTATFKYTNVSPSDRLFIGGRGPAGKWLEVKDGTVKLEKGNIATDWTPAPEDTEHKITTLNQQIEYIDGQLSAKLEQTDIDPINNKITEYGNSLTANAQSIESLINKTELHEGDITQWSNLTTETAEGLEQTISRVSTAEGKLSNVEFDIKANADSLKLTATKTEVENAIDGIEVGGRNIIPNSANLLDWSKWSINTTVIKMAHGMHRLSRVNPATGGAIGIHSKDGFILKAGNEYTLSYKAFDYYYGLPNYIYILSSEQGNTKLSNSDIKLLGSTGTLVNQSLYANQYKLTFTFPKDVKDGQILIGYDGGTTSHPNIGFYISDVQLEKGNKSTDWSPAPEDIRADITQLNTDINIEAGKIETLISKTELHDGDITQWSNETKANAESISQTLTRVEETEAGISQAHTDIQTNADGIAGVIRDVEAIDGNLSSLTTDFNVEAGKVETLISKTDGHDTQLTNIVADYEKIEQTVAANDEWLGTHGSNVLQTVEGFEQKVWQSDIQNPNLLPYSNMAESSNHAMWLTRPADASTGTYLDYMIVRDRDAGVTLGTLSPLFADYVVEGETYTVSWEASFSSPSNPIDREFKYFFILRPTEGNVSLRNPTVTDLGGQIYRYESTFVMPKLDPFMRILFGTHTVENQENFFRIRKAKLEKSSFATPYDSAFSMLEQRADEISLKVQDLASIDGEDLLTQSDISVSGGRITIGSQVIGSDDLASIISVSPTAIDMITDKLNLTGNLNVSGQITTLAVDAVEGNFARLFANQLTTNVIKSDHIEASTSLIRKLFVNSARIDELITQTHFVNEMHALTLNVVDLNASQIRTKLLSANTIEAEWIKSGTALLDRVFSSTAMFERMMAKSAFVTTLSTVTLDLHELTIWRPDGVAFVQNGVPRFGTPVFFKPWMSAEGTVTFDGSNYNTTMSGAQRFEIAYTEHAGRYLSIGFSANLRYSSSSTSTYMGVVVRVANQPSSTNIQTVIKDDILVFRDNPANEFQIDVPLGRPTYGALTFQLEFYRIGGTSANTVQIRSGRAWING